MTYRVAVFVLVGVVGLAALGVSLAVADTPSHLTGRHAAHALCRSAFGSNLINSTYGAVATANTLYVPATNGYTAALYTATQKVAKPFHDVFPGANKNATMGWCWTGETNDYKLYVVTAGYRPVLIESRVGAEYHSAPHPVGTSTIYGQP